MKTIEFKTNCFIMIFVLGSALSSCGKNSSGDAPPVPSPSPVLTPIPTPSTVPTPTPSPSPSLGPDIPVIVEANLESIQKNYVDVNCVSCHKTASSSNRHVDLTDISTLIIDKIGTRLPVGARTDLIVRGCPNLSFFFTITRSGEMPPGSLPHAKPEELTAMNAWITGLKSNADCSTGEPETPGDRGPGEP